LNAFCALFKQNVFWSLYLAGSAVIGIACLDMAEFLVPLLEEQSPNDVLIQQEGAHPHFDKEVMDFSNLKFPNKYIGKGRPMTWPPR
jgi:hypothetical protein